MGQKNAKTTALWLLSIKNYSKKEIFQKLKKKGFSEPEIEQTVQQCVSWGFLNDEEEARGRLKRFKRKGYGSLLVKRKMAQAGLQAEEISIEEEKALIQALLEKPAWKKKTPQQIMAALQRRGFQREAIFAVVKPFDIIFD